MAEEQSSLKKPGKSRRKGRGKFIIGACIALIIVILVALCAVMKAPKKETQTDDTAPAITADRHRDKLDQKLCSDTDYYKDEQNMVSDPDKMLSGLKDFYQTTGVQPFVFFTQTENLSFDYAEGVYESLFTDDGHFLLLIHNRTDADGAEHWNEYYYIGGNAIDVIDDDLTDIFWQYFDANYKNTDLSTEELISRSFSQTAAVFSNDDSNTSASDSTDSSAGHIGMEWIVLILLIFICLGGAIVCYKYVSKKPKKKKRRK